MKTVIYTRVGNSNQLNNNIKKLKVAIYTRVSTQQQADKGISLDAQKDILIKYCNDNRL